MFNGLAKEEANVQDNGRRVATAAIDGSNYVFVALLNRPQEEGVVVRARTFP